MVRDLGRMVKDLGDRCEGAGNQIKVELGAPIVEFKISKLLMHLHDLGHPAAALGTIFRENCTGHEDEPAAGILRVELGRDWVLLWACRACRACRVCVGREGEVEAGIRVCRVPA